MRPKVNIYNGTGWTARFQIFYKDDQVEDNLWTDYFYAGDSITVEIPFKSPNLASRSAYVHMNVQNYSGAVICEDQALIVDSSLNNTASPETNVLVYYSGTTNCNVSSELYDKDNLPSGSILTSNNKYDLSCLNYKSDKPFVLLSSGSLIILNMKRFGNPDPCTIDFPPKDGKIINSLIKDNDADYMIYIFLIMISIVIFCIISIGVGSLYYYKVSID